MGLFNRIFTPTMIVTALFVGAHHAAQAQTTGLPGDVTSWNQPWYYSMHDPVWPDHAMSSVTEVEGVAPRLGDTALRFEIRPGECGRDDTWSDCENDRGRYELAGYDGAHPAGSTHWYAFSIFIPEGTEALNPTNTTLGQLHEFNQNVVFAFDLQAQGYTVQNKLLGWGGGQETLIANEDLRGRWHDILVHATWSADLDTGSLDIWVNRDLAYEYDGRTMRENSGRGVFFKFGIYRSFLSRYERMNDGEAAPTQIVYYDEIHTGSSAAAADRVGVSEIQSVLAETGHYTSAVDGLWGPGTMGAVNAWLDENGHEPVTGYDPSLWHVIVHRQDPADTSGR